MSQICDLSADQGEAEAYRGGIFRHSAIQLVAEVDVRRSASASPPPLRLHPASTFFLPFGGDRGGSRWGAAGVHLASIFILSPLGVMLSAGRRGSMFAAVRALPAAARLHPASTFFFPF
jgi:hypothetical protein